MGLHKICKHKGRARDRCKHAWWGSFRGKRVSLAKWTNREIKSKAEADKALDELTAAIRDGTFDERGLDPPPDNSPMTFGKFAEVYKQRHVLAKGLALSSTIDYRLKPLIERFGNRPIAEIKTADIDDFVADLKRPRVVNGLEGRRLTPASINRTLGLLRHMVNWAIGREYPRSNTIPPRHRGADPEGARGQQTTPANQRVRRGRPAGGRVTAPAVDDHRRPGHWHAARRDAGAAVRGHRLDAADDHAKRRDDEEPTHSARPGRDDAPARGPRMAQARQRRRAQGRRCAGLQ